MRIMLIDEDPRKSRMLIEALYDAGYDVAARVDPDENLYVCVRELQPDVIIMDTDSPQRDTLEHLCIISRDQPRPIVMFTDDNDAEKIRSAVKAGVSAYVVDGLRKDRVKSIIEVAVARFEQYQALKRDLEKVTETLAERKQIERAKGVVMKQKKCGEDEAYRILRKMAMDRNMRLVDVAKSVNVVTDILG
ncbi:MAG: ANTAR domain-containing response regulator [Pseudomonadota bacterium]